MPAAFFEGISIQEPSAQVSSAKPMLRVVPVHTAVRGRARLYVDGLHRAPELVARIEAEISRVSGIEHISASSLTGKVLVRYNSGTALADIVALLERLVPERPAAPVPRPPVPDSRAGNGKSPGAAVVSPAPTQAARRGKPKQQHVGEAQDTHPWHALDATDALQRFEGSPTQGLAGAVARARLEKYGPNALPRNEPRSALSIFIDQFKSLPVALLAGSAALSVLTGGLADAVVIMGVVVINAVIGYVTESQAEMTINALSRMVRSSATVLRDGTARDIDAEDVVPGDLLVLAPGSYVAADARLVELKRLSVDESALTGESMPVVKTVAALPRQEVALADRTNMVYMGTVVTGGSGFAMVVATGRYTELGTIQELVGEARPPETPMQRQLDTMGNQIVILSSVICGAVFGVGLLRGFGLLQMLKASIALAVAAVPEGLPTVATTTLALGIRHMRGHRVLIRHLDAVETLGALQMICLDKTGTITLNSMTVVSAYVDTTPLSPLDWRAPARPQAAGFGKLMEVSVLCNETELAGSPGAYELKGSPTESALVRMAMDAGLDVADLRRRYPVLRIDYRSDKRNFMTTVHAADGRNKLIAVKGSPPEVLAMAGWLHTDSGVRPITETDRVAIATENERMAGDALRVLGVAYAYSDDDHPDLKEGEPNGLIWVGLVGMADPIREGVKPLIKQFHAAGIDAVMITGDQSPTAYAVGRELELNRSGRIEILDSSHLDELDPALLTALAQRVQVFARVSPAHKLEIVQALQRAGKVVAMTGDGINDGPALKAADIGIAMGTAGTDVARTVADVVIEDDNLQTLISAVSQGRTIYGNIRKSIHFLLATNLSEILVMFGAIAAGIGQPLSPMQLLWINLVSDIFPGLALAMEPPEPEVMSTPPRSPDEPIVRRSDLKRIGFEAGTMSLSTLAAYSYGIARYGIGPQASSLAFMSLTSAQLLHALSCRSETHSMLRGERLPPNRPLSLAVGGSLALQLVAALVPGLRSLLGITPVGIADIAAIGAGALLPLLINEATKPAPPAWQAVPATAHPAAVAG